MDLRKCSARTSKEPSTKTSTRPSSSSKREATVPAAALKETLEPFHVLSEGKSFCHDSSGGREGERAKPSNAAARELDKSHKTPAREREGEAEVQTALSKFSAFYGNPAKTSSTL